VLSARDLCNAADPYCPAPRCRAYVKLSLLPAHASASAKSHWRSDVVPPWPQSHLEALLPPPHPSLPPPPAAAWSWDEQFSIELSDVAAGGNGNTNANAAAEDNEDVMDATQEEFDAKARLLVTVWHREPVGAGAGAGARRKKRGREEETTRLLGCMAFSLRNIKHKQQVPLHSGLDTKDCLLARGNQIWLTGKRISIQTCPTDNQIFCFFLLFNTLDR
jgi:hypothetical protein